jgi:beta-1,4-mannosyltransferase
MALLDWLDFNYDLTPFLALSTLITLLMIIFPTRYDPSQITKPKAVAPASISNTASRNRQDVSVQVVVLGDIGHSPRMVNHVRSIVSRGGTVQFVGYKDSSLKGDIANHPNVKFCLLPRPPKIFNTGGRRLFAIFGPLKVIWQVLSLTYAMAYTCEPTRWMLIQVCI